jgi:RNA polymerase sigma factor (sigma-70 family)
LDDLDKIIEGCKKRNRRSQEKMYSIFYPALFALCKKFFSDNHEVLTTVNNGMLKVFSKIDLYDSTKGNFSTWVYIIVRNCALSAIRKKSTAIDLELSDNIEIFYDSLMTDDTKLSEVYKYLDILPDTTRVVCSLFYLENYSLKEIAGNLNMKEGTVKWHLHQSRERIKSEFGTGNSKQFT